MMGRVKTLLHQSGFGWSARLGDMRDTRNNRSFNIIDIVRELGWRDTSKAGDETLAIASLLNVSPFMLSHAVSDDRIRLLLLAMERVSRSLPFLQVDKPQTPGFRWRRPHFFLDSGAAYRIMEDKDENPRG
ncbi:hypothetical protein N657DRAFT_274609 [Parathielavia appendiculata]|uniref:Uncharacterized protein n=1 Tax=Parathielavia appendiculata TaxID=2587402 RepID=A0AAN6Z4T6_9PEZI|nr:hypothetical protein N657DRAFT_274609 [Parathielavia appendiculata]